MGKMGFLKHSVSLNHSNKSVKKCPSSKVKIGQRKVKSNGEKSNTSKLRERRRMRSKSSCKP